MLKNILLPISLICCASTFAQTENTPITTTSEPATIAQPATTTQTEQATDFTSPSTPIVVTIKKPVATITLQSNQTTGYSWILKSYDDNLLNLTGHIFVAPKSKQMIGAPGYEVWTFQAKQSAFSKTRTIKAKVVLMYARPWATMDATETTFTIELKQDN